MKGLCRPRLIFVFAVILLGSACSTPPNIREKSAAGMELYFNLLEAHRAFASALESDLKRRDRLASEMEVRTGAKDPQFETPLPIPKDTQDISDALQAIEHHIEISRLLYSTVDRFLRVEVLDLDDVKAVTAKARDVLERKEK